MLEKMTPFLESQLRLDFDKHDPLTPIADVTCYEVSDIFLTAKKICLKEILNETGIMIILKAGSNVLSLTNNPQLVFISYSLQH